MPKTPLTDREVLDLIWAAVDLITEQVEDLKIQNEELREAIANVSTPGVDFGIDLE